MPVAEIVKQSAEQTAIGFNARIYNEAFDRGINVSQLLERMDPTSEDDRRRGSLDAFERVLQSAGIVSRPDRSSGIQASTFGEATNQPNTRAMMVEWASRIWRGTAEMPSDQRALLLSGDAGVNTIANAYVDDATIRARRLIPTIPLNAIIARQTAIRGDAYRSVYITDDLSTDAYRMKRVSEGADIPETTLVTGEHTLRLHKFGRSLRSTYEQLRRQRIDRIAFIIQRMALMAEVDKVTDAMNTIINGDGNANTAAIVIALTSLDGAAVAGTLTLKGWLTFKARFTNAYQADSVLGQETSLMQLLLLPVNTVNGTPLAMLPGGVFGSVRPMNNLFGNTVAYGITADAPALKLIAFDSSLTLEMVTEIGGEVSEVERFINNQTQLFTLTEVMGFGILDTYASRVLNINA